MTDAVRISLAAIVALAGAVVLTEPARRLAIRTGFLDHPIGYKRHVQATPYLGGLAVVAAMLAGWTMVGGAWDRHLALSASIVGLLAVGLLDDRLGLPVPPRFLGQIGAAVALWATHNGWSVYGDGALNLLTTILWVVGIVNAFNLMDNLDGAAGSVAATSAVGVGVLALLHGAVALGGMAIALAAACVGFLPYNLARPAKIFLGDAGSTPIGLAIAGLVMATPTGSADWTAVLAAAPLVGLPIFDTTLVVCSRYRRRVTILSGARDHVTHRALGILRSPRRVAGVLVAAQLVLCALGIGLYAMTPSSVATFAACYLALGAGAIILLDDPRLLVEAGTAPRPAEELQA